MPPIDLLTRSLSEQLSSGAQEPASRRIADEIWLAVVEGSLETGERLPTARELAVSLGVSPRSVDRAYRDLEERGVVSARPGEGTCISIRPPPAAEMERHRQFADLCREAYDRARELGFSVDDVRDALADFRSVERGEPQ